MFRKVLIIFGGILTFLWGVTHLFPTSSIIKGFGEISTYNKNIILMEWINEGLTLIFIGILILLVTTLNKENNKTLKIVYITSSLMLFVMAVLSLFTGFNINFLPFKIMSINFLGFRDINTSGYF